MNIVEILRLKYPNADFFKDILLSDHGLGAGPEIREWNLPDPVPTQKDLDAWALEFDLQYRQQQAVQARRYPSIGQQLDMLYHDKMDGTDRWAETILAIKEAHPKPLE